MPARLVPLTAGSAPVIPLQRPVVLVGRHPECDARLDLPKVSRRHCCIALAYDRMVIRDLGSRNGVKVNGRAVDESGLEPGDEVAIGPILFRVEDPDANEPARPAVAGSTTPDRASTSSVPRPPSLPSLPLADQDADGDLIPLDV